MQCIASYIICWCFVYLQRFNADDNLIIYWRERSKQIWVVLALLNINFLTTDRLSGHTAKVFRAAQPSFIEQERGQEGKGNSILQFLPYLPHYLHWTFLLQSNKFPNFVTKHIFIRGGNNTYILKKIHILKILIVFSCLGNIKFYWKGTKTQILSEILTSMEFNQGGFC